MIMTAYVIRALLAFQLVNLSEERNSKYTPLMSLAYV